ncbi:thymidylate synthase, flavin-dependent [Bacteroides phage PhiCrAssBcn1]|nr:thymidylate synthase, flavin-dependent [Bacteroides phage PhiCrAssBcn1]WCF57542.1 thymidylate synthase, flavin-dependent [Bacteroides phage PhiCrAssBcn2]WCF57586.1 thymidylate synthase, flavin-dependent [Bacteroides phage PhiCrAssBcn3]
MRIIKPSFEIWDQQEGLEGIYKQIERAGRVCYKSEDKITETSAKEFVERMIKSGHGAMLEHGTVYLDVPNSAGDYNLVPFFASNPYSRVVIKPSDDRVHNYVTTNFRVIVENVAEEYIPDILQYLCEPTECHEKRITVRFICDRGVSHEFVRHRVFSFAQESTRYCNYSKDKFQGVTYIQPPWLDGDISNEDGSRFNDVYTDTYLHTLTTAENAYLDLLKQWDNKVPDKRFKSGYKNNPWTPQQARAVLPNSLKTELVMTGFISDWEHFFKLRDAGNAHPQARELAHPLHMEFLRRNYLVDLYDEANPD